MLMFPLSHMYEAAVLASLFVLALGMLPCVLIDNLRTLLWVKSVMYTLALTGMWVSFYFGPALLAGALMLCCEAFMYAFFRKLDKLGKEYEAHFRATMVL